METVDSANTLLSLVKKTQEMLNKVEEELHLQIRNEQRSNWKSRIKLSNEFGEKIEIGFIDYLHKKYPSMCLDDKTYSAVAHRIVGDYSLWYYDTFFGNYEEAIRYAVETFERKKRQAKSDS